MINAEKLIEQFEMVRASGHCNMLDYRCVAYVAIEMGCLELAGLDKHEYKALVLIIIENDYEIS